MAQRSPDGTDGIAAYMLIAVASGALYSLWRYARTSEGNSRGMRALALQFAHDEAV